MQLVISAVVVLGMFVALPLWLAISLRHHTFGELMYGKPGERKSTSGVGNALMELDRLLTRPSVEYRVEAEDQDKLSEDEKGGE
jgi:hypothetical protein